MNKFEYARFILFIFFIAFLTGIITSVCQMYLPKNLGSFTGYFLVPALIAGFVHWRGYFSHAGFLQMEQNLFQPYFTVSVRDRFRIIFSMAVIGLLPVIISVLVEDEFTSPWHQYGPFFTVLFVYVVTVAGYGSILFETTRKIYNNYLIVLIILLFGPSMYLMDNIDLEYNIGLPEWMVIFFSFMLVLVGGFQLLNAARIIADSKAKADAELAFAGEVQKKFLQDKKVETDEVEAFASSRPAANLGGDFFFLDGKAPGQADLIAAVGDVSGHSFGAGLVMVMLKTAFEGHLTYKKDPSELFKILNSKLFEETEKGMFATMAILTVNVKTGKALLWNAGHMPVLHYSVTGRKLTQIRTGGLALGLLKETSYEPVSFSVEQGDYIVLYSDGLIEVRDDKGEIRPASDFEKIVLSSVQDENRPEKISNLIMERVIESHSGNRFDDDATMVIIRIMPDI